MSEASSIPEKGASDEKLMLAFSQGSVEAFAELFRRYKQPIYGFFRRRVADAAHSEELAQETFLALVRSAGRYEPRALFRTYVYAIALKMLRNCRRRAALRGFFVGGRKVATETGRRDATESAVWVRGSIAKLDAIDREIVMQREYEQLSYGEIAACALGGVADTDQLVGFSGDGGGGAMDWRRPHRCEGGRRQGNIARRGMSQGCNAGVPPKEWMRAGNSCGNL